MRRKRNRELLGLTAAFVVLAAAAGATLLLAPEREAATFGRHAEPHLLQRWTILEAGELTGMVTELNFGATHKTLSFVENLINDKTRIVHVARLGDGGRGWTREVLAQASGTSRHRLAVHWLPDTDDHVQVVTPIEGGLHTEIRPRGALRNYMERWPRAVWPSPHPGGPTLFATGLVRTRTKLFVVDGAGKRLVSGTCDSIRDLAWHPDGTRAVVTCGKRMGPYEIREVGVRKTAFAAPSPAPGPAPTRIRKLRFSPDGEHVAMTVLQGSDITLQVASSDLASPGRGLERLGTMFGYDWMDDEALVAGLADPEEMVILPVDGGAIVPLGIEVPRLRYLAARMDGDVLFVAWVRSGRVGSSLEVAAFLL